MLTIPKFWLLSHNEANLWTRVWNFTSKFIPTHKDVFEKFLAERKWQVLKSKIVDEALGKKVRLTSGTTVADVPYSIRLHDSEIS